MVEVKFAPDKPVLVCITKKKELCLCYIENNFVHQFSKEEQKKLLKCICESEDDIVDVASKCIGREFADVQLLNF